MQEVVTNLMTTKIEVREEDHPDVVRHVHPRHVRTVVVPSGGGLQGELRNSLLSLIRDVIRYLVSLKVPPPPQPLPLCTTAPNPPIPASLHAPTHRGPVKHQQSPALTSIKRVQQPGFHLYRLSPRFHKCNRPHAPCSSIGLRSKPFPTDSHQ